MLVWLAIMRPDTYKIDQKQTVSSCKLRLAGRVSHLVGGLHVRALSGERHLDAGGPPGDEVDQLALPYPLQGLVHLGGVHGALNDVQDGDVAALARVRRHHDVLRLRQPAIW